MSQLHYTPYTGDGSKIPIVIGLHVNFDPLHMHIPWHRNPGMTGKYMPCKMLEDWSQYLQRNPQRSIQLILGGIINKSKHIHFSCH